MKPEAKEIKPLALDMSFHPKLWHDFVGDSQSKSIHADLYSQLLARDSAVLVLWKEYPDEIQALAADISRVLLDHLEWPNPYFIPADPVELLLRSSTGDLEIEEAAMEIEALSGKRICDPMWHELVKLKFADFLRRLHEWRTQ